MLGPLAALSEIATSGNAEFPSWKPGTLDIHHINTGRGNSSLMVCPDGTSILIDAGAVNSPLIFMNAARPNDSLRAGQWIARYVQRHLRAAGPSELDYLVATHQHGDHMGEMGARR
jgi:beta-lactamase superfamily II metal-dependent hydrolase